MNLGQFLTAKSPLPSGTVAQHLAAIAELQAGSGQGTVFASQFSISIERNEIVVTRKAKLASIHSEPVTQSRLESPRSISQELVSQPMSIFIRYVEKNVFTFTPLRDVFVTEVRRREFVLSDNGDQTVYLT